MEASTITHIIGWAISLIVFVKYFYDFSDINRKKLKENYEFSKLFFEYLENNKNINPLVIERGYHVLANNGNITINEIEYLLKFERPSLAIRIYVNSRDYLFYNFEDNYITYRKQFINKTIRMICKYFSLMLYFVLSLFSFFMIWLLLINTKIDSNSIINFVIIIPGSIILAYNCLKFYVAIRNSERIIQMQELLI